MDDIENKKYNIINFVNKFNRNDKLFILRTIINEDLQHAIVETKHGSHVDLNKLSDIVINDIYNTIVKKYNKNL
jgi:hypothetical protein